MSDNWATDRAQEGRWRRSWNEVAVKQFVARAEARGREAGLEEAEKRVTEMETAETLRVQTDRGLGAYNGSILALRDAAKAIRALRHAASKEKK